MPNTAGYFYPRFTCDPAKYQPELKRCIENTVDKLLSAGRHPIMLLGKIQSGKTRAFMGVLSLVFDNDFDICVVLTKGTRALAKQTYERIQSEFEAFIPTKIQVYDIMGLPPLSGFARKTKLVFVVKKQTDNLDCLRETLFETYPDLSHKRILLVDDEADFASIGYAQIRGEGLQLRKIASQINDLRRDLPEGFLLQVTATPYSLYLQPEEITIHGIEFEPVRPAFTELVPVHEAYVGGDIYFPEGDADEENPRVADFIHIMVDTKELAVLKKKDLRRVKLEDLLATDAIIGLRRALTTFATGVAIRQLQDEAEGKDFCFYSFLVHTEQSKRAHDWQEELVFALKDALADAAREDDPVLRNLLESAYDDLAASISLGGYLVPDREAVIERVIEGLKEDHMLVTKVNSDEEVLAMLDRSGQLHLQAPMNIFIGGQILDRGITIANMIGFYYGRNPKKFQQDTVLQHSRMYGFRSEKDVAVTRFYTSVDIYVAMKRMQESDNALRKALEATKGNHSVIFIQKSPDGKVTPCSPNKIMLSEVTTLRPHKRLLPVGFQSGFKSYISKTVLEVDDLISSHQISTNPEAPFVMPLEDAITILRKIYSALVFEEPGYENNLDEMIGAISHLSQNTDEESQKGLVYGIWRGDRDIQRIRKGGRFSNAPDSPYREGKIAREQATHIPALLLLKQNGNEEIDGWKGTPFYWPVLITPLNTKTAIFANQVRPEHLEEDQPESE